MTRWKIYAIGLIALAFVGISTLALGLTQSQVCVVQPDGSCVPTVPTGAHAKHSPTCSICHKVAGTLSFDPAGPAYSSPSGPIPSFDATAKTCSNVACHGVAAGTYSYYFPGNEMDADGYPIPELKVVNYGGYVTASTPSWYVTGAAGCTACHGNPPYPPLPASDGSNNWHSGLHANSQPLNACELCHNRLQGSTYSPIAQSSLVSGKYMGTAILIPAQHANGTANVAARFQSSCFGCH